MSEDKLSAGNEILAAFDQVDERPKTVAADDQKPEVADLEEVINDDNIAIAKFKEGQVVVVENIEVTDGFHTGVGVEFIGQPATSFTRSLPSFTEVNHPINLTQLTDEQLDSLVCAAKHLKKKRYSQAKHSITDEQWDKLYTTAKKLSSGMRESIALDATVKTDAVVYWMGRALPDDGEDECEETMVGLFRSEVNVLSMSTTELLNRMPHLKPQFEKIKQEVQALKDKVESLCKNSSDPAALMKFVWTQINTVCENHHPEYFEN